MEDSQIVALYWERNEDAIAETDRKYGGYCRAIAMNILSDHRDAEECVNDTWLQTWNAIPPHRPTVLAAFLGPSLGGSVWTAGGRIPGKAGRRSGTPGPGGAFPVRPGPRRTGGSRPAGRADHALEVFLKGLSSRDRDLFLCRYWYLASVREIAQAFRLPESRVKAVLFRTRNKLKIYLEQEGFL